MDKTTSAQEQLTFTREYPVRINEIGANARLTLDSIFCYLQDISNAQVSSMGIGVDDLQRLGITWILSRICLETEYLPAYGETVLAQTWPNDMFKFFVPRHILLSSKETGNIIGRGSCFWLMLNMQTGMVVRPQNYYPKVGDVSACPVFFRNAEHLDHSPGDHPVSFVARNSFIDFNKHVNNRFFLSFILDWLSERFASIVQIHTIQINFNAPLVFGETLTCSGITDENNFRVTGHSPDGRNIFTSKGTFSLC